MKEKSARKSSLAKATAGLNAHPPVNPVLAGILHRTQGGSVGSSSSSGSTVSSQVMSPPTAIPTTIHSIKHPPELTTPQALAKAAVGRGVKHAFSLPIAAVHKSPVGAATQALQASSFSMPNQQHESLSQLEINYRNSIIDMCADDGDRLTNKLLVDADPTPLNEMVSHNYSFLSRDSSLVDLAMIPAVGDNVLPSTNPDTFGLTFLDFPNDHPTSSIATAKAAPAQSPSATDPLPADGESTQQGNAERTGCSS